jgi:hypothetical protein
VHGSLEKNRLDSHIRGIYGKNNHK